MPSKQRIRLYPQLNAVAVTESGFDERPYRCPARAGAALRDWMASTMAQAETSGSDLDGRSWERRAQRADIMNTEPELRGRASYYPFERVLAEAIGKTLASPPTA